MAKKQTSYERIMEKVTAKYEAEHGTVIGVQTWLANGIGSHKQRINLSKRMGRFPDGYVEKISKFTGIPLVELLRSDVADEVNDLSRKWRATVQDTETALIRLGLDQINRK